MQIVFTTTTCSEEYIYIIIVAFCSKISIHIIAVYAPICSIVMHKLGTCEYSIYFFYFNVINYN